MAQRRGIIDRVADSIAAAAVPDSPSPPGAAAVPHASSSSLAVAAAPAATAAAAVPDTSLPALPAPSGDSFSEEEDDMLSLGDDEQVMQMLDDATESAKDDLHEGLGLLRIDSDAAKRDIVESKSTDTGMHNRLQARQRELRNREEEKSQSSRSSKRIADQQKKKGQPKYS